MKICFYGICKDEAKFVDRWCAMASEADYAFALDTGSEDETTDILDLYMGKDPKLEWAIAKLDPFRFDDARNTALAEAEMLFPDADVFMTTDFDEYMEPGWADLIRENWDPEKHERIRYSYRWAGMEVATARNWGHSPRWRWKYPCHEVMMRESNGEIWYSADEELNLEGKLEVIHTQDGSKSRDGYLPKLKLRWEEYRDLPSLAYLLREMMDTGKEKDRITSYADDVQGFFDAWIDEEDERSNNELMMCFLSLADGYCHEENYEDAEFAYKNAIGVGPVFRRPYIAYAKFLIDRKRADEAYRILEEGLVKASYTTRCIFVDAPGQWQWEYDDWMSVAAYWAGWPHIAIENSLSALMEDPLNEHIRSNLQCSIDLLDKMRKEGTWPKR